MVPWLFSSPQQILKWRLSVRLACKCFVEFPETRLTRHVQSKFNPTWSLGRVLWTFFSILLRQVLSSPVRAASRDVNANVNGVRSMPWKRWADKRKSINNFSVRQDPPLKWSEKIIKFSSEHKIIEEISLSCARFRIQVAQSIASEENSSLITLFSLISSKRPEALSKQKSCRFECDGWSRQSNVSVNDQDQ